jgi:C4-dicarboxylate transporter DctQ subunit
LILVQSFLSNRQKNKKQKINFSVIQKKIEIGIPLVCMILMTTIIFIQVAGRYLFHYSISWSEEVGRYLVIWITFGGSALAFRKGAHIGVNALVNILPTKIRYNVKLFSQLITIGFFVILGYYGTVHTANQIIHLQLGPATRLPMAIPYSAIPIGSALAVFYLINKIIRDIKNNNKESKKI